MTWRLPASKTDPGALKCERPWGCLCPAVGCPCCTALEHIGILKDLFGESAVNDSFPLFLNAEGGVVSEQATQPWSSTWRLRLTSRSICHQVCYALGDIPGVTLRRCTSRDLRSTLSFSRCNCWPDGFTGDPPLGTPRSTPRLDGAYQSLKLGGILRQDRTTTQVPICAWLR